MRFKLPKDDNQYHWTSHSKGKMIQYQISESLVKRIISYPKRTEEGIAPATLAAMRPTASKKSSELWVMYKKEKGKKFIISTWRYPGVSPIGKPIIIPNEVLEELEKWFNK